MSHTEQKLVEVIAYYSEQISKDPESIESYVFRSACYESLGAYVNALKDAEHVMNLDGYYWKGFHQALKMHMKLGNIREAETIANNCRNYESFKNLVAEFDSVKASHDQEVMSLKQSHQQNREDISEKKLWYERWFS